MLVSAVRAVYAEAQGIHVALQNALFAVLERAVGVVADTFLQKVLALRHALGNHLVQEAAVVAFHAHALDPEDAYRLHIVSRSAGRGFAHVHCQSVNWTVLR